MIYSKPIRRLDDWIVEVIYRRTTITLAFTYWVEAVNFYYASKDFYASKANKG